MPCQVCEYIIRKFSGSQYHILISACVKTQYVVVLG